MGDKKLPGIAAEDIGRCAYGIFKKGREFIGKTVGIAGEHLTGSQMAAAFSKALGKEVGYNAVPPEVYRSFGFPGAEDLGNMFQFKRDFEEYFCGVRDLSVARSLNPSLQTFDQWLAHNKSRHPAGVTALVSRQSPIRLRRRHAAGAMPRRRVRCTTESGLSAAASSQGMNWGSPEFPITTQKLRSHPRYFARLMGERAKMRRKSSSVIEARSSNVGLKSENGSWFGG